MEETSMTQGVVVKNVDAIIEEIRIALCQTAAEVLRDNDNIKTALRNGWSGVDCEVFIENFDKAVEKTCAALEHYEQEIRKTLNSIPQQWSDFQSTNVKSVE